MYVELPPGGVDGVPAGTLARLVKPVYGLMDAPRAWYKAVTATLRSLGMEQSKLDPCVYIKKGLRGVIGAIALHVDDMLMSGTREFEEDVLKKLRATYPFKHWKCGQGGPYLSSSQKSSTTFQSITVPTCKRAVQLHVVGF